MIFFNRPSGHCIGFVSLLVWFDICLVLHLIIFIFFLADLQDIEFITLLVWFIKFCINYFWSKSKYSIIPSGHWVYNHADLHSCSTESLLDRPETDYAPAEVVVLVVFIMIIMMVLVVFIMIIMVVLVVFIMMAVFMMMLMIMTIMTMMAFQRWWWWWCW